MQVICKKQNQRADCVHLLYLSSSSLLGCVMQTALLRIPVGLAVLERSRCSHAVIYLHCCRYRRTFVFFFQVACFVVLII